MKIMATQKVCTQVLAAALLIMLKLKTSSDWQTDKQSVAYVYNWTLFDLQNNDVLVL